MPFDKKTGRMKANTTASAQARSKTAGPGGSFPIGNESHAEAAIRDAPRSEAAGHISAAQKVAIQAKARAALARDKK